jgi:hypothetical protein
MKRPLVFIFLILIVLNNLFSQVNVNGYYRKDGTYVTPHVRSIPDNNPFNNYSFPGNLNPYTGKIATGNIEAYLNKYYNRSYGSLKKSNYEPKNIEIGFYYLETNELKAKEYFIKGYKSDPYNSYEKQIQCLMIAMLSIKNKDLLTAEKYLDEITADKYEDQFSKELGFLYYDIFKENGKTKNLIKSRYFFEKFIEKGTESCSIYEILLLTYHYFEDDISFNNIANKSKTCGLDLRFHTNQSEELAKIKEMFDLGIITIKEYNEQIKKIKTKNE